MSSIEDPRAAAGAVGVLALLGAGVALNRRRKRRLEEEEWAGEDYDSESRVEDENVGFEPAPETAAAVGPAAAATSGRENRLPNGFDLSRFGPHVQAAYRGPTPDNPSLSLRHRLRRAAAMDQAERRVAADPAPSTQTPIIAPKPQSNSGSFMFTRATAKPALSPAGQR